MSSAVVLKLFVSHHFTILNKAVCFYCHHFSCFSAERQLFQLIINIYVENCQYDALFLQRHSRDHFPHSYFCCGIIFQAKTDLLFSYQIKNSCIGKRAARLPALPATKPRRMGESCVLPNHSQKLSQIGWDLHLDIQLTSLLFITTSGAWRTTALENR